MTGVLITILGLLVYLAFCVDWKELMAVLRLGSWATLALYVAVALIIVSHWGAPGSHGLH